MLHEHPGSFGSDYGEFQAKDATWHAERYASSTGGDNVIFGAFVGSELIGAAGVYRMERIKQKHASMIWGVYVEPGWRNHGAGKRLVQAGIDYARSIPGVDVLRIGATTTSVAARSLYFDLGFQPYGFEPDAIRVGNQRFDEEVSWMDVSSDDSTTQADEGEAERSRHLTPVELAAQRLELAARELHAAARHGNIASGHFREGAVPRGTAHTLATLGHIREAEALLEEVAREHARRARG